MHRGIVGVGVLVTVAIGACTVPPYPPPLQPLDASVPDGTVEAGSDGSMPDASLPDATIESGVDATLEAGADADDGGVDADDGGVDADDGGVDADGGAVDASDGAVLDGAVADASSCFAPPLTDPSRLSPGSGTTFPYSSFGCSSIGSFQPRAATFALTKQKLVVYSTEHHLTNIGDELRLMDGCTSSATYITGQVYNCTKISTTTLAPGLYTVVGCSSLTFGAALFFDTPVPVGANTTCNAAAPLPVAEPYPILDGNPRYYSVKVGSLDAGVYNPTFKVKNTLRSGTFMFSVHAQCGGQAVFAAQGNWCNPSIDGENSFTVNGLGGGTYIIMLSQMPAGAQPTVL